MKQKKKKQQGKNKNWIFVLLGIIFLVVILIVLTSIQQKQTSNINKSNLSVGSQAPEFTLQSTQGNISLADYKGKNVVLFFYEGNGCQACIVQLSELNDKVEEYAKKNTEILAITTDPVSMSKQMVQKNNIQIPVLYDPNQKVGKPYGVTDVPGGMDMGPVDTHSVFVIDQKGVVRWYEISQQEMYVPIESIDKELQKIWE